MNLENVEKSKMTKIESLAESIRFSFAKDNKELNEALGELVTLIQEEKKNREQLRDVAWLIANKM